MFLKNYGMSILGSTERDMGEEGLQKIPFLGDVLNGCYPSRSIVIASAKTIVAFNAFLATSSQST